MTNDELRTARHTLALTQRQMAPLLEVTVRTYEQLESKRVGTPPHHAGAVEAMLADPTHPARAVARYRYRLAVEEARRRHLLALEEGAISPTA